MLPYVIYAADAHFFYDTIGLLKKRGHSLIMEQIYQMEYRGLNLFDEISTVELAIDEANKTIHIYDVGQVVTPVFNFDVSAYELSDGFYKMAEIGRAHV